MPPPHRGSCWHLTALFSQNCNLNFRTYCGIYGRLLQWLGLSSLYKAGHSVLFFSFENCVSTSSYVLSGVPKGFVLGRFYFSYSLAVVKLPLNCLLMTSNCIVFIIVLIPHRISNILLMIYSQWSTPGLQQLQIKCQSGHFNSHHLHIISCSHHFFMCFVLTIKLFKFHFWRANTFTHVSLGF
jgi:hypothetical protein